MPPTVQQGSTGDAVSKAQYLLVRWLILPSDQIDGSFGPATTHAVEEFQSDEGLTVDGIVGPNTWQAMLAGFSIRTRTFHGIFGLGGQKAATSVEQRTERVRARLSSPGDRRQLRTAHEDDGRGVPALGKRP